MFFANCLDGIFSEPGHRSCKFFGAAITLMPGSTMRSIPVYTTAPYQRLGATGTKIIIRLTFTFKAHHLVLIIKFNQNGPETYKSLLGGPLRSRPANPNPALAAPGRFHAPGPREQASLTRFPGTQNPAGFPAGFGFDRGAGDGRALRKGPVDLFSEERAGALAFESRRRNEKSHLMVAF